MPSHVQRLQAAIEVLQRREGHLGLHHSEGGFGSAYSAGSYGASALIGSGVGRSGCVLGLLLGMPPELCWRVPISGLASMLTPDYEILVD